MRITYLHQYFNTPQMSGSTRSYELARRLVEMGHEVNVVTSWRQADARSGWFASREAGIKVHWLPVLYSNRMSFRERVQAFVAFAWRSGRKAASLDADVVFATSTPLTIALPATYAANRLRVPMVFEVRDLWPDVPRAMGYLGNTLLWRGSLWLEQFAYKSARHIVALTPTMRDFLSGKGVPLEKISVVPNFSDIAQFQRLQKCQPEDPKVLLYCGNLGPAHGPMCLVGLAQEFMKMNAGVRIEVVGDGKLCEQMKDAASKSGSLGKTIIFHGPKAKEDVPAFYADAHASLLTMDDCELLYRHSVQNKFFDSLAAGVPVIANYRGYASELAERMQAGIIVKRDDLKEAARKIVEFLEDQERLERAAKAARALAEERFDANLLAKKLEAILHAVVSSSRVPRSQLHRHQ
jgi:glycosyltransferase involved in cell wall biosynthesis